MYIHWQLYFKGKVTEFCIVFDKIFIHNTNYIGYVLVLFQFWRMKIVIQTRQSDVNSCIKLNPMLAIFSSNVTTKFVRLHYFLSQNIGGTKDIVCPFFQKFGRHVPLNVRNRKQTQMFFLHYCLLLLNMYL